MLFPCLLRRDRAFLFSVSSRRAEHDSYVGPNRGRGVYPFTHDAKCSSKYSSMTSVPVQGRGIPRFVACPFLSESNAQLGVAASSSVLLYHHARVTIKTREGDMQGRQGGGAKAGFFSRSLSCYEINPMPCSSKLLQKLAPI